MLIVVVSPANAVELDVPNCNKDVSPSSALPEVVPKPGNVVLAVLEFIALACELDIVVVFPLKAVLELVPKPGKDVTLSCL